MKSPYLFNIVMEEWIRKVCYYQKCDDWDHEYMCTFVLMWLAKELGFEIVYMKG